MDLDGLRRGVALAELGGHGDGPYCATHAAGAALAILGTYVIDPGPKVDYPAAFVFPPDAARYGDYLRRHVAAARAAGGQVAVSGISLEPPSRTGDFLATAAAAGADWVSLCLNSTMPMFTSQGLGVELTRRPRRGELRRWVAALTGLGAPLIVKIWHLEPELTCGVTAELAGWGVPAVHVNLVHAAEPAGLEMVSRLRGRCPLLIIGGGIATPGQAARVLDAGADVVAVGRAAMADPGLLGRMQAAVR